MLFPKFTEGLEAVLYIALNSGENPVSSKEICAYQNALPRHLEPVMQTLVREGILKGTKGPKGGYRLAREKRKITAGEIFTALNKDSTPANRQATDLRKLVTEKLNDNLTSTITSHLSGITIEDLCKQAEGRVKIGGKVDFNI